MPFCTYATAAYDTLNDIVNAGVESIEATPDTETTIHNLNGVKVNEPAEALKGVYIVKSGNETKKIIK